MLACGKRRMVLGGIVRKLCPYLIQLMPLRAVANICAYIGRAQMDILYFIVLCKQMQLHQLV